MRVFLLFCLLISGATAIDFLGSIFPKLTELWRTESIELFQQDCHYVRKPQLKGLQLKFQATVTCPGWAPFSGRATKSSPTGSVQAATKDFVDQAIRHNLVTPEEAKLWRP